MDASYGQACTSYCSFISSVLTITMVIACMHPERHGGGRKHHESMKRPPHGAQRNLTRYSFRAYQADVTAWCLYYQDLSQDAQCLALIDSLGGTARLVAKSIGSEELLHGGTIGGQQTEPVSYLITGLQMRFRTNIS